jgi:hypothetical protein
MTGVAATGPRSLRSAHLAQLEPLRFMAQFGELCACYHCAVAGLINHKAHPTAI